MSHERRLRAIADICAAIVGISAGILVVDYFLASLPFLDRTLRICLITATVAGIVTAVACLWKLDDLRKLSRQDKS